MVSFVCNALYVEDVKDRSNTPKGCNAMYVEDVEDGKRTYTHIWAHNFHLIRSKTLPTNDFELTVPDLYTVTCCWNFCLQAVKPILSSKAKTPLRGRSIKRQC